MFSETQRTTFIATVVLVWAGACGCSPPGQAPLDVGADSAEDVGEDAEVEPIAECEEQASVILSEASTLSADRHSNAYTAAGMPQRRAAARSVAAARDDSLASASIQAEQAGYELCRISEADEELLVWQPSVPRQGRPIWALRLRGHAAPLVLEAPHAYFDLNTLEEGRVLFDSLAARAVLVSGTHRCANDLASSCSGTTGVCTDDGQQPYRNSDMAHRTDTLFQTVHRALSESWPGTTVLSLHGFTDDGVSLSDGTTDPTSDDSVVAQMARALESEFADAKITVCNDYPGANRETRLCGSTNVQGRHLNGSANACTERADHASGRFIHMEQSGAVRDAPDRVGDALGQIFESK